MTSSPRRNIMVDVILVALYPVQVLISAVLVVLGFSGTVFAEDKCVDTPLPLYVVGVLLQLRQIVQSCMLGGHLSCVLELR